MTGKQADSQIKRYGVIVADPPWSYDRSNVEGAAAREYSTMTLSELCALPVKELAAKDAVLLMWGTWPKLDEACLPLLKAWGFTYVTGFPWIKITSVAPTLWGEIEIKVPYGVGFWARGCSEIVFIGKRGNVSPPDAGFIGLLSPNLYHSRKPDDLYEYAEALPGPYLELFARRARPGWDIWGNEVECSLTMPEVKSRLSDRESNGDPGAGARSGIKREAASFSLNPPKGISGEQKGQR